MRSKWMSAQKALTVTYAEAVGNAQTAVIEGYKFLICRSRI